MTILDTIDHAVADWETSPDAMRWTPGDAPVANDAAEIARLFAEGVEQVRIRVIAAFDHLGRAFAEAAEAFKGVTLRFGVLDELRRPLRRPEHLSRMRRAYGARRGHR